MTVPRTFAGKTGCGFDPKGNLYLVGAFSGTIDLGGGPMTSVGKTDLVVVKLKPGP